LYIILSLLLLHYYNYLTNSNCTYLHILRLYLLRSTIAFIVVQNLCENIFIGIPIYIPSIIIINHPPPVCTYVPGSSNNNRSNIYPIRSKLSHPHFAFSPTLFLPHIVCSTSSAELHILLNGHRLLGDRLFPVIYIPCLPLCPSYLYPATPNIPAIFERKERNCT
jgi:hypothetical protein